ncbi:rhodanese-like domain-containing protein [bacterium]|nr:rhodanese-like domain-containing protein [bacterium]
MKSSKELVTAVILVLVIFGGISAYWLTAKSEVKSVTLNEQKTVTRIERRQTGAPITLLTFDEVKALHKAKKAIFLDARSDREFAYAHIPGALEAYYAEVKANPQVVGLNRNQMIVAYCSSDKCPMAELLATKLIELGFSRIYVFPGGMKEWISAKMPVQSSGTL